MRSWKLLLCDLDICAHVGRQQYQRGTCCKEQSDFSVTRIGPMYKPGMGRRLRCDTTLPVMPCTGSVHGLDVHTDEIWDVLLYINRVGNIVSLCFYVLLKGSFPNGFVYGKRLLFPFSCLYPICMCPSPPLFVDTHGNNRYVRLGLYGII